MVLFGSAKCDGKLPFLKEACGSVILVIFAEKNGRKWQLTREETR
jgi:hypothetical protein